MAEHVSKQQVTAKVHEPRESQRGRATYRWVVGISCAIFFFMLAYATLCAGHPSDDSYILFRYVENTANGHGIVFNVGGERAEGATDFLWFALLTLAVRLGADVALFAAGLNAIGAGLAGWVLSDLCWGNADRPMWARAAALCGVVPLVVFSGGALAAYLGFSSMLYSALVLLLYAVSVQASRSGILMIPVLGLTVALFRPDGVFIGVLFGFIGLQSAWSERILKRYLWISAACAVVGLAYFAWRWNYFGLPLPLPLYVKQHSGAGNASGWLAHFPGLPDHIKWLTDRQGPTLMLLGLLGLFIYGRIWRDAGIQRAIVLLIPGAALLAALAFATQSQNVQWRFQAPVHLMIAYLLLYVGGKVIAARTGSHAQLFVTVLAVAVMIPTSLAGARDVRRQIGGQWNTYLETFAPKFGPYLDEHSLVVLTEAGILPFWSKARVVDAVGLNTVATALRPVTISYIQELDPDLVFFHNASILRNDTLTGGNHASRIISVTPEVLWQSLPEAQQEFIQQPVESYEETGMRPTSYAALLLTRFLSESSEYEIFAVDILGNGTYLHVYGIKAGWPLRNKAIELLNWSVRRENYRSYMTIRAGL